MFRFPPEFEPACGFEGYTFIINAITGNKIHYYNGLAVHLRHNVMRWHTNTRGFGFQAEILCLLIDLGFTHKQFPFTRSNNVKENPTPSNSVTSSQWRIRSSRSQTGAYPALFIPRATNAR